MNATAFPPCPGTRRSVQSPPMRLLFIGDIVWQPGREATKKILPELKDEFNFDLVIANGENLSEGNGMTLKHTEAMHLSGIDVFTSGNHIWKQKEIVQLLDSPSPYVLRPDNFPQGNPGRGWVWVEVPTSSERLLVINLQGRVFMKEHVDCPFRALDRILKEAKPRKHDAIFVDFHAEATSEKTCLGLYAAALAAPSGAKVSALVGTHTHVPTADERLLKNHMAYISDVGSVGLKDSAIGVDPEPVIEHFLTQRPARHTTKGGGPVVFNSVIIDIEQGRATAIQRVAREIP